MRGRLPAAGCTGRSAGAASRVGTSFCAPTMKMTLAAPPGVGGELAARRRRGDNQGAVPGDRVHAAQGVVGLAADRHHFLRLGSSLSLPSSSAIGRQITDVVTSGGQSSTKFVLRTIGACSRRGRFAVPVTLTVS